MLVAKSDTRYSRARHGATPQFVALCKTLYGDIIDPDVVWDEVIKLAPDQADTHAQRSVGGRILHGVAIGGALAGTGLAGAELAGIPRVGGKLSGIPKAIKAVKGGATVGSQVTGKLGLASAGIVADVAAVKELKRPQGGQLKPTSPPYNPSYQRPSGVYPPHRIIKRHSGGLLVPSQAVSKGVWNEGAKDVGSSIKRAASGLMGHYNNAAKTSGLSSISSATKTSVGAAKPPAVPSASATRSMSNWKNVAHEASGGPRRATSPARATAPAHTPVASATAAPSAAPAAGKPKYQPGPDTFLRNAGRNVAGALGTPIGTTGVGIGVAGTLATRRKAPPQYADYGKRLDDVIWEGTFSKLDTDKRLAFGWATIVELNGTPVLDKQGDIIEPEEIEKAAYDYVINSRVGGNMHKRDDMGRFRKSMGGPGQAVKVSDMVESMVFTDDKVAKMGLPDDFPRGWWVGFKVHDPETWEMVKKGERTGFSIHGRGIRKDVDYDQAMGY